MALRNHRCSDSSIRSHPLHGHNHAHSHLVESQTWHFLSLHRVAGFARITGDGDVQMTKGRKMTTVALECEEMLSYWRQGLRRSEAMSAVDALLVRGSRMESECPAISLISYFLAHI